ncbi:Decapping and exoribonuclease protein [Zancudomyces culisetae]|uniref:Decapping nuclease n=1 Tax=Zancudomyces culisetae TaxID=1213189 RepID=A0A1R1PEH7_ZANCU|nr:Decapping and exoribonuclease protein [Zancudomyces culisetae]|eukprot:OMH79329.1 Decapping and exoribonuclease protein [Zancudomyces culisetae]
MSKDLLRTINISNFTRFEHHHGNRHHKNNTHTQPSNFSYSYPTEISSFSLDSQRQVVNTDEQLKYYNTEIEHISKSRGQNYDLSAGFDSWIYRKVPTNEHLDHILTHLTYCLQNKADFGSNLRAKKPDFVMYRGMMSKILLTPYSMNESWSMNVVRFNGTLFIENNLTEQDIARVVDLDERSLKFMYSGYKFEQYGTMDTPQPQSQRSQQRQQQKQQQQQQQESPAEADGTPVPPPVNSIEEYSFVFTAKFSQFNMLIAAEVDCVDGEKPHTYPNSKYVELKTSKLIRSERDEYSFNR